MKKTKLPSIIVLMILSLITVLFWISASVYRVFTTKEDPKISTEIIQDLNPTIDRVTLNQVEGRIYP